MDQTDKPKFMAALVRLAGHYRERFTPEMLESWWDLFAADWTLEEFGAACRYQVMHREWMPKPFHFAEWRRSRDQIGAEQAWARVLEFCRGRWRYSRSIGDPIIDAAVAALGGYEELAINTPTEYLPLRFKKFEEAYEYQRDREEIHDALPPAVKQLLEDNRS